MLTFYIILAPMLLAWADSKPPSTTLITTTIPTNTTISKCALSSLDPEAEQGEDQVYMPPRPTPTASTRAHNSDPQLLPACKSLAKTASTSIIDPFPTPSSPPNVSSAPPPRGEVFAIGYHRRCVLNPNSPICASVWKIYSDSTGNTIDPCTKQNADLAFGGKDQTESKFPDYPKTFNSFGNQIAKDCTWKRDMEGAGGKGELSCAGDKKGSCSLPTGKDKPQRCDKGDEWVWVDVCTFVE